jgi:hypothetical protein
MATSRDGKIKRIKGSINFTGSLAATIVHLQHNTWVLIVDKSSVQKLLGAHCAGGENHSSNAKQHKDYGC